MVQLDKELKNVESVLLPYIADLSECEQNLAIKGKTLSVTLKEQPAWAAYYGTRLSELDTLLKYAEIHLKRIRGNLLIQFNENYNPKLSERIMEKYIDNDSTYLDMYERYLKLLEVHSKYGAIMEAFNKRGFALRDITVAKINAIHEDIL